MNELINLLKNMGDPYTPGENSWLSQFVLVDDTLTVWTIGSAPQYCMTGQHNTVQIKVSQTHSCCFSTTMLLVIPF